MLSNIIKVIILIAIIAVVALVVGPCVYYGFIDKPDTGQPSEMPCIENASHSFYIKNTSGLILASDWEQHGQDVGSRIFILHGFWELRGKEFKFVAGDIILDESIFGKIVVAKRTKDG